MFAAVDVEMSLNSAVDIFCGGADVNDVPTTIGTNGQVTLKPRKHLFKGHFGVISRQGTQGSHGLGRGDQAFLKFTRVGRTAALGLIKTTCRCPPNRRKHTTRSGSSPRFSSSLSAIYGKLDAWQRQQGKVLHKKQAANP